MSARVAPPEVIDAVESYIETELADARKYDNREPFDESGCYELHLLAAKIYATGWTDGERAERRRTTAQARRTREAQAET